MRPVRRGTNNLFQCAVLREETIAIMNNEKKWTTCLRMKHTPKECRGIYWLNLERSMKKKTNKIDRIFLSVI